MTLILYFLLVVFLLINSKISTVFLFAIVALWSRLPGMGHPVLGPWLITFDMVDIFSMIIAINMGGFSGAIFSVVLNIGSGFFGKFTNWFVVIKDALAQFVVCLIIPFVYSISGNIIFTMTCYTILRSLMFLPMQLLPSDLNFHQFIVTLTGWTILLIIVNNFYAAIFGNLFDSIIRNGEKFSWVFFIFVTLIIVSLKVYFYIKNNHRKKETEDYY